jgi:hypothetical protein
MHIRIEIHTYVYKIAYVYKFTYTYVHTCVCKSVHDYIHVYIYNPREHEHMHSTRDVDIHTNSYKQLTQELTKGEAHRTIIINLPGASRCFCRRLSTQERGRKRARLRGILRVRVECVC